MHVNTTGVSNKRQMIDYDYDGEEMKVDSPFSVEITVSLLDAVLHCKDVKHCCQSAVFLGHARVLKRTG